MADAAQSVLTSRKQQQAEAAVQALQERQGSTALQQGDTAQDLTATVDSIWTVHLDQQRAEAVATVRAMQERHEDALRQLRLDQAARAREQGIRPQRRSKELLNLRRSESVLASQENYFGAFKVKAAADVLAEAEASGAYRDWLLRCHGEQEQLLARQHRELEALCKRLDRGVRNVEAERERDLEKLKRNLKVVSERQRRSFVLEQQYLKAGLNGCLLNTRTTRKGKGLADAFPTLARMATARLESEEQAGKASPSEAAGGGGGSQAGNSSHRGSGYLGPASAAEGMLQRWQSEGPQPPGEPEAAAGVRFAPTPPREAWAAGSMKGSEAGGSARSHSGKSTSSGSSTTTGSRPSTSSSSTTHNTASVRSDHSPGGWMTGLDGAGQAHSAHPVPRPVTARGLPPSGPDAAVAPAAGPGAPGAGGAAPSSVAAGSGTTGKGSGSSALTEEALRAMNQAMGTAAPGGKAQRGASSLQTSSFKSNVPYAGGLSPHGIPRPAA